MSNIERSPLLYSRSVDGRLRFWFMERDGARYRSGYGFEGSDPTYTGWTTARGKNVGRVNETDPAEQAEMECQYEYFKKQDRGFSPDPAQAGVVDYVKPMLAKPFERKRIEGQPWIAIQPKLDGIRCIVTAAGAFTRNGKPILSIPHVLRALAPTLKVYPGMILDGELYNHALREDFNRITSLVRKQKPTDDDLFEVEQSIRYYVYDMPSCEGDYVDRHAAIEELINHQISSLGAVHIQRVGASFVDREAFGAARLHKLEDDRFIAAIEAQHERNLLAGFEGTMIRLPAPYEFKRTSNLLKFKDFQDGEFEIVEVQEGNGSWAGYAKRVELRLPDGRTFGAGIKGNQETAKQLLDDKDQYVGKTATVRFFARTPDGVPRFPVVVAFDPVDR